jgi:hypothetical protein
MEPVSVTPTQPANYAVLTLTYTSLLSAVAYGSRRHSPLDRSELVPLAAASFALAKLIGKEKVETWVRQPFVDELPDGRRPKGGGMRYAVGELLTCTRCLGAWTALGLVSLRLNVPEVGRTVTTVLATSAGNDFLQSGFTWLCARSEVQKAQVGD